MHLASASAPGSAHINPGQPGKINNQDALAVRELPNGMIAVVCDGCGSQPYSGIGADIGAHIIAQVIKKSLPVSGQLKNLDWFKLTNIVVRELKKEVLKYTVDDSLTAFEKAVVERFLFTATALVVVGDLAIVASFGDGLVIVDDEIINLPPPILNSPPYLGYLLLQNSNYHSDKLKSYLQFSVIKKLELSKLTKGLIIGTDGLLKLLEEDLHHPALVQPQTLQRWLNAQTTEKIEGRSFIQGRCHDDVTLVIVRTEAAQERLFNNRVKIAALKQDLMEFQKLMKDFSRDLDEVALTLKEAKEKAAELNNQLQEMAKRAKEIKSFENKVASLKAELETLSQNLEDKTIKPTPPPVEIPLREFHNDHFPYYGYTPPAYTYREVTESGEPPHHDGRFRTLSEAEAAEHLEEFYLKVSARNQQPATGPHIRPKKRLFGIQRIFTGGRRHRG